MLTTVVLMAALAASHEPVFGRLSLALDGGGWESGPRSSRNLGGTAAMELFSPRVVDDDAPLSLQPFLQNVSSVSVAVGARGFSTDDPMWPDTYDGRSTWGTLAATLNTSASAGLEAAVSVKRLGTTGPYHRCTHSPGLSLDSCSADEATSSTTLALRPSVRFGDTRMHLSLRATRTAYESHRDEDEITVDFAVQSVVMQTVALRGEIWRGTDAAGLSTGVSVYWTRAFQTGISALFHRDYLPESQVTRVAGALDASYWLTGTTRIEAEYTLSRVTQFNGSSYTFEPLIGHTVMLASVVYLD